MKIDDLFEDGRIVKGVNTTPDVGTNQTSIEAAKFGNKVDKDGRPPTLSKKVKGSKTNVLFNLGMTEDTTPRYTAAEWAIIEGGHTLEEPEEKVKLFDWTKY
jgi:3-polyprenyl-4-hydroxybenzoate decarboxylase